MADQEYEVPPLDDFEVEITDLEQVPGLRPLNMPRFTPRQRKIGLAFTATLFVLVIGVLLASVSDVRNLLTRTIFPITPTIASPNAPFYLQGDPSWGQFAIDGKTVSHLPVIGRDTPLSLAPGSYQISWHAAPFRPQTCTLEIVNSFIITGSCFSMRGISTPSYNSVQVISFFASLNDLASDLRTSLLQKIQAALDAHADTETVQQGELYALSYNDGQKNPSSCKNIPSVFICYTQAKQPLLATMQLQPDVSTSDADPCIVSGACLFEQRDCRVLCADPEMEGATGPDYSWDVISVIRLSWTYSTPGGQIIARDEPNTFITDVPDFKLASLHITWHEFGWQVIAFPSNGATPAAFDDPLCDQASEDTMVTIGNAFINGQPMYVQSAADLQTHWAAGCLAVVKPASNIFGETPTPTPASNAQLVAYFLQRFGVVLAANDVAHRLWPYLPIADAYEKSLAQSMFASLPTSS